MDRLLDALSRLAAARDVQEVMRVVRTSARELAQADGATLVLREGDLCHYVDEDAVSPLWKGRRFPMDVCISGWAMLNQSQVAIRDIYADSRVPAEAYRPTFVKSLVMTPVRGAKCTAAIGTYWADEREPDAETRRALAILADASSAALDAARLNAELLKRLKELEEQKRMRESAETFSRLKGEFLANMSHEIRTPLNAILGMTELALASDAGPKAREYLGHIQASGRALLSIVNDVLDLAKIEAGKVELRSAPFKPRQEMDALLRSFGAIADEKALRLSWSVDPAVPDALVGDAGRLRQVLTNLVGNAIKFTDRGEVSVRVSLADDAPSDGAVRLLFTCADSGVGIHAGALETLFESFTQAGDPSQIAGTGLGLNISRRLVEMMGGRIWAESRPGRGSVFFFTADFRDGAPRLTKKRPPAPRPEPLRVLLAEDNGVSRLLAQEMLRKRGHEVVSVVDGREALARLSEAAAPFDVVLLDVRMPEVDGVEVVRRIRSGLVAGVDPTTPAIALTAHAFKDDRERLLAEGMTHYLAKPIDFAELDRMLFDVSRSRPGAPGADDQASGADSKD